MEAIDSETVLLLVGGALAKGLEELAIRTPDDAKLDCSIDVRLTKKKQRSATSGLRTPTGE